METTTLTPGKKAWITRRSNLKLKQEGKHLSPGKKAWVTRRLGKTVKSTEIFKARLLQKDKVRSTIARKISRWHVPGKILTLPSESWAIEKKIVRLGTPRTLSFLACEYNPTSCYNHAATMSRMKRELNKNPKLAKKVVGIIESPIGNLIRAAEQGEYAHALLDYCGTFHTYEDEIKTVFDRNIVKIGGMILITCTKTSRLVRGIDATKGLRNIIDRLPNYRIVPIAEEYIYEYQDPKPGKTKGTKMVAMIAQRIA